MGAHTNNAITTHGTILAHRLGSGVVHSRPHPSGILRVTSELGNISSSRQRVVQQNQKSLVHVMKPHVQQAQSRHLQELQLIATNADVQQQMIIAAPYNQNINNNIAQAMYYGRESAACVCKSKQVGNTCDSSNPDQVPGHHVAREMYQKRPSISQVVVHQPQQGGMNAIQPSKIRHQPSKKKRRVPTASSLTQTTNSLQLSLPIVMTTQRENSLIQPISNNTNVKIVPDNSRRSSNNPDKINNTFNRLKHDHYKTVPGSGQNIVIKLAVMH